MKKKMYTLRIDPEFSSVAPPLTDAELRLLRESLQEEGCMNPLVVWNGVIIDGHNRYRICQELGIPFAVEEIAFEDRAAAKIWIVKNQIARRNLTPFQRCELVMTMESTLRAQAKINMGRRYLDDSERIDTRAYLAKIAGVSNGTFGKVHAIMENGDDEMKRRLRAGEVSIHWAYTKLFDGARKTKASECPTQMVDKNTDIARQKIEDLIIGLSEGFIDRGTVINTLTEVSAMLERG